MNFSEALEAMKEGDVVRRDIDITSYAFMIEDDNIIMFCPDGYRVIDTSPLFDSEDVLAEDWEKVEIEP